VQGGDGRRGAQLDVVRAVEVGVVHGGGVEAGLAAQVALREGWAFVGPHRLVADQHDPAAEALAA
jgi:hypothetical protein